ncbi:MAG: hypothetical protein Q8S02_12345 [Hydrogenophaga sp.]|nr:hypothetical protein [Hydrogenophaga sp.]
MNTQPLHQCATCAAFLDGECINLVSVTEHGVDDQPRGPRADDVCDDYEAEPDLLTSRLMRNLTSGPK